ncbi:MAG: class I SAM-dependent methyltransferase [Acidimicrobiia bacterium]|nr:class I SAM-dependent methyltransferase [Acidimicrobiia bacterium]
MSQKPDQPLLSPVLDSLPVVNDRRLAVRVTPDALRQLRGGHPWVYDRSIVSLSDGGVAGDLAVVFDRRRNFAGIGLYDPASPIRLKMLHVGTPATIDADWFSGRIDAALRKRADFVDGPSDGAYRVVNGENDLLPSVVVDRYADVLVVKIYSAAWWPWLRLLTGVLIERTGATHVVLRLARLLEGGTGTVVDGAVIAGEDIDGPVAFTEGGLRFEADVRRGQKTGYFLDQRGNRLTVGSMSAGRDVLDVFASTGGFSVHAAAGGARRVHSVDLSAPTLLAVERNMELNSDRQAVSDCLRSTEVGDAFQVMAQLAATGQSFDIVVVDPPSFAQRHDRVDSALRAYSKLTHLACALVRPGGVLFQASCSSRVTADQFYATVASAAMVGGYELSEIARTGHELDHPIGFPEGEYLHAGFWTVGARR